MCTDIRFTWAIGKFIIPPPLFCVSPLRAMAFKQNQPEFMSSDTISDSAAQPPGSCCVGPGKLPPAFVPMWSAAPTSKRY